MLAARHHAPWINSLNVPAVQKSLK